MSKTWHHDMPQHTAEYSDSAEPTTHQALAPSAPIWFSFKLMCVTDAFIFSASAKAWRQRQIKVGVSFVGPSDKTWLLKKDIQLRHVESLWFKTWKNNPEIQSFIQHLHICWQLNSIKDERWNYSTSKPSKLSVKGCRERDIMTCRSIQRFCGASHTPGLGPLVANLVVPQIDVRDGRVYLQCLG